MGGRRWLTLTLAVAVLASCSPAPSKSPAAVVPPLPTFATAIPSLAPAEPAAPTPEPRRLADRWEPIDLPGASDAPVGAVHGDPGFVIVGTDCRDACHNGAAAWFSADGVEWERVKLPDANLGSGGMSEVAWSGSSYFAVGHEFGPGPDPNAGFVTAHFWRSEDGRAWTKLGSIELGSCYEGCPMASGLLALPDGAMFVGSFVRTLKRVRAAWSVSGSDWNFIKSTAVGFAPGTDARVTAATRFGSGIAAIWTTFDGRSSAWRTADAQSWSRLGRLDSAPTFESSIATDGRIIVVADSPCDEEDCTTAIWASNDAGPFMKVADRLRARWPRLTYTGEEFVLVADGPQALVWTSTDGSVWHDHAFDQPLDECFQSLAGGGGMAILIGCGGAWIARGT
jgi:hypothetical protein